jgi:hypothetical protein
LNPLTYPKAQACREALRFLERIFGQRKLSYQSCAFSAQLSQAWLLLRKAQRCRKILESLSGLGRQKNQAY